MGAPAISSAAAPKEFSMGTKPTDAASKPPSSAATAAAFGASGNAVTFGIPKPAAPAKVPARPSSSYDEEEEEEEEDFDDIGEGEDDEPVDMTKSMIGHSGRDPIRSSTGKSSSSSLLKAAIQQCVQCLFYIEL
jgi:hypothetical protein